jgi:PleD family two-component response regulator
VCVTGPTPLHLGSQRIVWAGTTQSDPAYPIHDVLRQAFNDLAELERSLVTDQRLSTSTRQQISTLSRTIVRVSARVVRLEREAAQLRHFAYHDGLTGLPNRTLLRDRLDRALAQASRQQRQAALLLLDLNGFKSVNDEFGHAARR